MTPNSQSQEEWTGELEQRIVDLESEFINLRQMIERIGREKRICEVPKNGKWMMYLLMLFVLIDLALGLYVLAK